MPITLSGLLTLSVQALNAHYSLSTIFTVIANTPVQ